LNRGGTHTGVFQGSDDTGLFLGAEATGQVFNFESGSTIKFPMFFTRAGIINVHGHYWPTNPGSSLIVQPSSEHCTLNFASDATFIDMPATTIIANWGKLVFESQVTVYDLPTLRMDTGGELNNLGNVSVDATFTWSGGKISGNGTTTISPGVAFTIATGSHDLDTQTLVNSSTANWNSGAIALANEAVFQNDGTFNANATTTMSGGAAGSFLNQGNFYKYGAGTTTTMDIEFTHSGNLEVVAGSLVFPSGMTSGDGTVVDLGGGTLGTGDIFNLATGASLTGTGTINGNLNNAGEVSPGASPGQITVSGDYAQTADGILTIELAGTTADSEFDQLVVSGASSLAGSLDVSLIDGFDPILEDTFEILSSGSLSGTFGTVQLPELSAGLKWLLEYSGNGVTLSVEQDATYIFLPLVIR
jgi:phage baseplate assembly protein gpV